MKVINSQQTIVQPGQEPIQNTPHEEYMTPFTGAWMPSVDPTLIGPNNYQDLLNMRYKKDGSGIEGVSGYVHFNSTALSNYTKIDTGIQFNSIGETNSYLVVHAIDDSGQGVLKYSLSEIGDTTGNGTFESDILHTDASVNLFPRLSEGPSGSLVYCNGEETKIWDGLESKVGAAFTLKHSADPQALGYFTDTNAQGWAYPVEKTDELTSTRDDATSRININSDNRCGLLILSTRKLDAIKLYIPDGLGNTNAANTNDFDLMVWDGTTFEDVVDLVDGTLKGTQTGSLTFSSDSPTPVLYHYEERYLYAYLLSVSATAGTTLFRVNFVTVSSPMQDITNVWDGIYRQPIQVQRYDATNKTYEDFTLHVSESSTTGTPVGLFLGQLAATEHFIVMFEEKISAIKFIMLGNLVNTNNAQLDTTDGVQYWDGDSWNNVEFVDGTLDTDGDSSMATTGLVRWNTTTNESKTTLFGTIGYAYRFSVDATLSGSNDDDITVDIIIGIPAAKAIGTYKFPTQYKNKLFLCAYDIGNEGNRIDYSVDNAPDVFNGEDSSMDGFQSIYVGSLESINAATQLYNRFGSNIYTSFVILKENETWLLTGDSPLDYKLFPISFIIGCPAPKTLKTAEVGFELGEQVERNIAMWISHQGPILFDGAVIHTLEGINNYFDPNSGTKINFDYLYLAESEFDSVRQEWNVLLPTGDNPVLDTWLVYNLRLKKWFRRSMASTDNFVSLIDTVDTNGEQHIYAGATDGKMYLLEHGANFNGVAINYLVKTGDFFPSNNQWDITTLRRIKLLVKRITEAGAKIYVYITSNTESSSGVEYSFADVESGMTFSGSEGWYFYDVDSDSSNSGDEGYFWIDKLGEFYELALEGSLQRLLNYSVNINNTAWCHSVEFSFTSDESLKGFEPVMWGYQFYKTHKDVY